MIRQVLGAGALVSVGATLGFLVGAAVGSGSARIAELDEDAPDGPFRFGSPHGTAAYRYAHRAILGPGASRPHPRHLLGIARRYGCVDVEECLRRGYHSYASIEMAATEG